VVMVMMMVTVVMRISLRHRSTHQSHATEYNS